MKADEPADPRSMALWGLGSELLGLPDEVGTLNVPALETLLADLEQAISEDVLFDIAVSVAITEFGLSKTDLADDDLEMFDD